MKSTKSQGLCKTVGGILLAAGVASVFLIDWKGEPEVFDKPVRPLKTMVIGAVHQGAAMKYPAKAKASQEVRMSFDVPGTVHSVLVKEGDQVKKGRELARLNQENFKNDVVAAQAEFNRTKAQMERVLAAAKSNAVSKQDVSNAEADHDVAKSKLAVTQKSLDDTVLYASFDGVIASIITKEFENVQAKQQVLTLQNVQSIEIEASIPESRVARSNPETREERKGLIRFTAEFDYFAGRVFELTAAEFKTEADAATQTYTATFAMEAPKDVTILPGMTAMVTEHVDPNSIKDTSASGYALPIESVPVDGVGAYFVWLVEDGGDGLFRARRKDVKVGELTGSEILVTQGLDKGDRVALAGAHILQEGQQVRLLAQAAQ